MLDKKSIFSYLSLLIFMLSVLSMSMAFFFYKSVTWYFQWTVFKTLNLTLEFPLLIDIYAKIFLFTVSLISSSVILFSVSYMAQEKFFWRFHSLLIMFVLSMFMLILSPNMVSVLLGWDGLGLTSYLLVVYFQSSKSYNAGMLTALSNRVGDVLILSALAFLASSFSWNFSILAQSQESLLTSTLFLLIVAACTKSAQLPFSAWLPAAMAAPTPVSSLVHSSTLVTAGVYLTFRLAHFSVSTKAAFLLFLSGFLTMFMAGMTALVEPDMKKIIALSTLSQLGIMMLTLGSGNLELGYFHMVSHAFLKALLFMTIGAMIHSVKDYQDMRKSSILPQTFPLTLAFNLMANLSLCGFPFTSGFYSKDLCIEIFSANNANIPLSMILYFATALTAMYTARLISLTLLSSSKLVSLSWTQDRDNYINLAMPFLFFFSLMGANWLKWMIFFSPSHFLLPLWLKNLTLILISGLAAMVFFKFPKTLSLFKNSKSYVFLWGLPFFSSYLFNFQSLIFGKTNIFQGDLHWNPMMTLASIHPTISSSSTFLEINKEQQIFQGLGISFILVISIFLYLYMTNFFVFFSFKN